jgi:uncharacterized protein (TIGR02246 family)
MTNATEDEQAVRTLIENWAQAVRDKNLPTILAHHADDFVMFDVPPPFQSVGIEAYRKTWDLFFGWASKEPSGFDIEDMTIVAGDSVAFCYASMRCAGYDASGKREELRFRLTVGLEKIAGEWIIRHEHHSVPSE